MINLYQDGWSNPLLMRLMGGGSSLISWRSVNPCPKRSREVLLICRWWIAPHGK